MMVSNENKTEWSSRKNNSHQSTINEEGERIIEKNERHPRNHQNEKEDWKEEEDHPIIAQKNKQIHLFHLLLL